MSRPLRRKVVYAGEPGLGALGLQVCLDNAGYELSAACRTVRDAFKAIEEYQPELVIIGTMRPPERAFRLCRTTSELWPEVSIVMTCWNLDDESFVADVAYVGASASIDACIEPEEIIETIRRVLAGSVLFTRYQVRTAFNVEDLTRRQVELLKLAAQNHSTAEISSVHGISPNTVRNIESEIRAKLNTHSTSEAAHRAERRGSTVGVIAIVGSLFAVAYLLMRRGDRTVIDRMSSSSRVDGKNDPRAYLHHSSY